MQVDGRKLRVEVMQKPDNNAKRAKKAIPAFRRAEQEDHRKAQQQMNPGAFKKNKPHAKKLGKGNKEQRKASKRDRSSK